MGRKIGGVLLFLFGAFAFSCGVLLTGGSLTFGGTQTGLSFGGAFSGLILLMVGSQLVRMGWVLCQTPTTPVFWTILFRILVLGTGALLLLASLFTILTAARVGYLAAAFEFILGAMLVMNALPRRSA